VGEGDTAQNKNGAGWLIRKPLASSTKIAIKFFLINFQIWAFRDKTGPFWGELI
jgi:hypothetical protein